MPPVPALRRSALVASIAAAAACLASSPVMAADCQNPLVNPCIDANTFWPHAGPARFLSVGGTETVAQGRVSFGLITAYQSRPVVLHLPSPGPDGSDRTAVDNQVSSSFLFAYGLTRRLELDLVLPAVIFQDGSGVSPITGGDSLSTTASGDMRFGAAYAIVPRERRDPHTNGALLQGNWWSLTARFEMSAPTGDQGSFASERTGVYIPSVAADFRHGRWFAGAELGLRVRPVAELLGARIGTQMTAALGVGYDILDHELLSVTAEARALPVLEEQATVSQTGSGLVSTPNGQFIAPAEWMLSVRSAPLLGGDLALQLGGGGWLPLSSTAPVTTPRFRFVLGLVFAPLGRDTDKDGVLDAQDRCPTEAGPSSSPAGPGCPVPARPPPVLNLTGGPT